MKEVSSAEETTSKLASYQASVMGSIDNFLMNFKDDVIRSVTEMHNCDHGQKTAADQRRHSKQGTSDADIGGR